MRLVFVVLLATASVHAGPRLEFESKTANLGSHYSYGYADGKFVFHNTGDEPLKVLGVKPDCSCTTVQVRPEIVPPGEQGQVEFKVHLPEIHEAGEKAVSFACNDPKEPNVDLKIHVETRPLFLCTPERIVLDSLPPDTATNIVVKVERADRQKINLTKADATDSSVKVAIESQSDPSGLSAELWVEIKPRKPGPVNTALILYESNYPLPQFFVNITGRVLPYVSIEPQSIFWGISDPENWKPDQPAAQRRILVRSNRPQGKLKVSRAVCTLTELAVEVIPVSAGEFAIGAKMISLPKTSGTGQIEIELEDLSPQKLRLPITIKIQGR